MRTNRRGWSRKSGNVNYDWKRNAFEDTTKKDAVAKEKSVIKKNSGVFHKNNRKDPYSESRIFIGPYTLQAQNGNPINSFQRPSIVKRALGHLAPMSRLVNHLR